MKKKNNKINYQTRVQMKYLFIFSYLSDFHLAMTRYFGVFILCIIYSIFSSRSIQKVHSRSLTHVKALLTQMERVKNKRIWHKKTTINISTSRVRLIFIWTCIWKSIQFKSIAEKKEILNLRTYRILTKTQRTIFLSLFLEGDQTVSQWKHYIPFQIIS